MKKSKWIWAGGVLGFAVLQLFQPSRTNPAVKSDFMAAAHPPATVAATLRAACYDCHSAETRWPWYARLAPASWLIARDVAEGRRHLNFSEWPAESNRAAKQLDRINEAVDYREMPPQKYTFLHAGARLTDAQRKELLDWTNTQADQWRAATNN